MYENSSKTIEPSFASSSRLVPTNEMETLGYLDPKSKMVGLRLVISFMVKMFGELD